MQILPLGPPPLHTPAARIIELQRWVNDGGLVHHQTPYGGHRHSTIISPSAEPPPYRLLSIEVSILD